MQINLAFLNYINWEEESEEAINKRPIADTKVPEGDIRKLVLDGQQRVTFLTWLWLSADEKLYAKKLGDHAGKKDGYIYLHLNEDAGKPEKKESESNDLFTGEFWSGSKAKELGLIDGLGNANEILKEKFGEDVVIKKFEKPKSWISKKFSSSEDNIEKIVSILEERSIWQRYGF